MKLIVVLLSKQWTAKIRKMSLSKQERSIQSDCLGILTTEKQIKSKDLEECQRRTNNQTINTPRSSDRDVTNPHKLSVSFLTFSGLWLIRMSGLKYFTNVAQQNRKGSIFFNRIGPISLSDRPNISIHAREETRKRKKGSVEKERNDHQNILANNEHWSARIGIWIDAKELHTSHQVN